MTNFNSFRSPKDVIGNIPADANANSKEGGIVAEQPPVPPSTSVKGVDAILTASLPLSQRKGQLEDDTPQNSHVVTPRDLESSNASFKDKSLALSPKEIQVAEDEDAEAAKKGKCSKLWKLTVQYWGLFLQWCSTQHPVLLIVGALLALLVVVSGAVLVLAAIGAFGVDQDQKDNIVEICSQILNGVFTLVVLVLQPERAMFAYRYIRVSREGITFRRDEAARLGTSVATLLISASRVTETSTVVGNDEEAAQGNQNAVEQGTYTIPEVVVSVEEVPVDEAQSVAGAVTSPVVETTAMEGSSAAALAPHLSKRQRQLNSLHNRYPWCLPTQVLSRQALDKEQKGEERTPEAVSEASTASTTGDAITAPRTQEDLSSFMTRNLAAEGMDVELDRRWKHMGILLFVQNLQCVLQYVVAFFMWYYHNPDDRPMGIAMTFVGLAIATGCAAGIYEGYLAATDGATPKKKAELEEEALAAENVTK